MIVGTDYQHDIGSDLLQEIILDDVYGIRGLDHGRVQYVLDVGANIGFFAVMARMLYPRAKIIAVEPIPATLDILRQNIAELDIAVDTCALGTGQPMYMKSMDDTDHTLHRVTTTPASGVVVPTKTLNTLVHDHGVDPTRCLFKFDCEGGEQHLLDADSEAILHDAFHIGIEFHQDSTDLTFPEWKAWLHRIASPQHRVDDSELEETSEPWRTARVFTQARY